MQFSLSNLKRLGRGMLAAGMVLGAALAVTNAAAQRSMLDAMPSY